MMAAAWWSSATAAGPTWAELLDAFIRSQRSPATARAYRQGVRAFHTTRGVPPSVTMRDVVEFRDQLRADGRSPATVLARLAAVSSWFRFLRRTPTPDGGRLIPDNPAEDVPAGRVEMYGRTADTMLELEDFRRILTVADGRLRAWLLIHVLTGRRRAEIARLRADDVERRSTTWWYRYRGKGKAQMKWRELPAAAAQALFAWRPELAQRGVGDGDGNLWSASESTLIREFKRAAVAAGVDPACAHAHALRHLGAQLRRRDGADIRELQEFLDHASPAVTAVYICHLEVTRDERADAIAAQLLGA